MADDKLKDLDAKLDLVVEASKAAQDATTKLETEFDHLKKADIANAIEVATKAAEEAQGMKLKLEAVEKTAEWMEKALARGGNGDAASKELEAKAHEQTSRYLRTGEPMDADVVEGICGEMAQKHLHGLTDMQREKELKSMLAGNNPQGGYFIRPERSAQIMSRIFETSPLRGVANTMTTNSDGVEILIDDDEALDGGWVGEVSQRPETGTPKIGLLEIPAHEIYAQPKASQKMLDDAGFDLEGWLSGKVQRKIGRSENTAFVVGDGSQKPKGFLTYDAWAAAGVYQRNALERINSGADGAVTGDGLKALQNSLIEEYQSNAVFGMKRSTWGQVIILKDDQGNYILDPRSLRDGDTMQLLGKPVIFMNDMPEVAADSLSVVYGDFSTGYTIVDRIGFRVIRDNVTSKPFVKYYTTKRTGGAVTSFEALKIQQLSA